MYHFSIVRIEVWNAGGTHVGSLWKSRSICSSIHFKSGRTERETGPRTFCMIKTRKHLTSKDLLDYFTLVTSDRGYFLRDEGTLGRYMVESQWEGTQSLGQDLVRERSQSRIPSVTPCLTGGRYFLCRSPNPRSVHLHRTVGPNLQS